MTLRLPDCLRRLWPRFRREDGSATVEFVLIFPLFMTVFMASFETGLLMVRQTMLERALDIVVRELRLGQFPNPTHDSIRDAICDAAVVLPECRQSMKVSLDRVDMTTWALPTDRVVCRDRASNIDPVTRLDPAALAPREFMLVRVCVRADAIFPSTGIAANLEKDGKGGYRLVAASGFVNEP
ncbi:MULTISPECIES: TadE/TadG family type IV pilus assembly protein [Gemmobacter]|jgi:Flp pilus assembly protein TadG|uniref:TadE-like protein n=2 Tax=Gemmobacter TaxID=204456 RepID=A0A2T6BBV8_9RHOB|nr:MULTISPECIES: TadE family protein [Gemmobacter]OJY27475.1 MAG: pilus assembly protein TadE [Rhodobacterales bacterium 65-51]PTX53555.1 TadE-like protein [Gemmobacter caeni]TWJ05666.1 TadE-like protein [Gemmobacter caeni]GHC14734.1 hypothetical protein GCM10007291_10640 [Gemmobacter nanjingensis]